MLSFNTAIWRPQVEITVEDKYLYLVLVAELIPLSLLHSFLPPLLHLLPLPGSLRPHGLELVDRLGDDVGLLRDDDWCSIRQLHLGEALLHLVGLPGNSWRWKTFPSLKNYSAPQDPCLVNVGDQSIVALFQIPAVMSYWTKKLHHFTIRQTFGLQW